MFCSMQNKLKIFTLSAPFSLRLTRRGKELTVLTKKNMLPDNVRLVIEYYICGVGRIIAVDYGKKRTGIAVTDVLQITANGLCTVDTNKLMTFLTEYLQNEKADTLVVGAPVRMTGEPSQVETDIKKFIAAFKKRFPDVLVAREDERFTSKMAMNTMIEGGVKKMKRRNKALVDQVSATLILQSYLGNSL